MQNEEQIKALIELIEKEPGCSPRLMAELARIIRTSPQQFRRVMAASYGGSPPSFVAETVNNIRREALAMPFKWYFGRHSPALMPAIILIAKFVNPGITDEAAVASFEALLQDISPTIEEGGDIAAKAAQLGDNIFGSFNFKAESLGCDARLLSLPDIINRRRATPLCMAVLYALLAPHFEIWADIIDVHGKPVVRLRDAATFEPVYVDVCAGGRFAGEGDCHIYASSRGREWDASSVSALTNKQILRRLLTNLIYVYSKQEGPAADLLRGFLKSAV
jgi:regulator of sirC expression with transglutaminase-like and TPR domain